MAELGDFITQGPKTTKEVTVEMMDYKYVEECEDPTELRAILEKLRSGEEGHYPHLNMTVEKKLMEMLPAKERRKILALKTGPKDEDIAEAAAALSAWADEVKEADEQLNKEAENKENSRKAKSKGGKKNGNNDFNRSLPPVRGQKAPPRDSNNHAKSSLEAKEDDGGPAIRTPSSHVYDAPNYFRKWDAYDAEAEERALDEEEAGDREEAARLRREHAEKERGRAKRREAELAELRGKMEWATMTSLQRNRFALLEKSKGNECYKAGEPEEAMHFYSRALALMEEDHEQAPVIWCNRGVAAIKLGLLEKAEDDCSRAIALNPSYTKARLRRGITRHKRGKYRDALADFKWLLKNDAAHASDYETLAERSRQKLKETEGDRLSKGKGGITEVSSSVLVSVADGAPPALSSSLWERKPFVPPPAPTAAAAAATAAAASSSSSSSSSSKGGSFTKVAISLEDDDDDDDSSDEDSGDEIVADAGPKGMTRVAITDEDDDEDEDEDDDEEKTEEAAAAAASFTRVAIADDSEEEEDEDDEEEVGAAMSEWDAEQLKNKGVTHFMNSQYPSAIECFTAVVEGLEKGVKSDPTLLNGSARDLWAKAHNNLAACRAVAEDWPLVVEHCDAVLGPIGKDPDNFKALLRRADARERLGQAQASVSDLRRCRKIAPDNVDVAVRLKRLDPALADASASSSSSSSSPPSSSSSSSSGDASSSKAKAAEASKIKGNECMKRGDLGGAHDHYTDALAADPANAAARNNRAMCLLRLERWAEAEADASAVLRADPNNAKALFRRATARCEQEAFSGAAEDLRATLTLEPTNGKAKALLDEVLPKATAADKAAAAEEQRKQKADADERARAARKAKAEAEAAAEEEAEAAAKAAKKKKAEADAEAAIIASFASMEAAENSEYAAAAAAADEYASASEKAAASSANDLGNSAADARAAGGKNMLSDDAKAAGNAAMAAGDFTKALMSYTVAISRDPNNTAALNNRAAAHLRLGDPKGCLRDASAVLDREPANIKALMRRAEARVMMAKEAAAPKDRLAMLDKAKNDLLRAQRVQPDNANAAVKVMDVDQMIAAEEQRKAGKPNEEEDEDEEEEEEPTVEDVPRSDAKPNEVPIQNEEEEEEEEEESKPVINGTRIMITDDDDDDGDDSDEEEEEAAAAAAEQQQQQQQQPQEPTVMNREASDAAKARGSKLLGKGDLGGADEEYSEALRLDGSNHAARNNRALCRLKAGKFEGAVADTTFLIDLAADSRDKSGAGAMVGKALFRRASAFEKMGDKPAAIKDLKRLLSAEPTNKEAKKMLEALFRAPAKAAKAATASSSAISAAAAAIPKPKPKPPPSKAGIREVSTKTKAPAAQPSTTTAASSTTPPPPPPAPKVAAPEKKKSPAPKEARVIKVKAKVPANPPRAMYELEKVWRELKAQSAADVAAYLSVFKASTWKKVFKLDTNPDIVLDFLRVCDSHLAASSPKAAATCLKGIAKCGGFSMTLMMLSDADKSAVRGACATLEARPSGKYAADVAEIKKLYGL